MMALMPAILAAAGDLVTPSPSMASVIASLSEPPAPAVKTITSLPRMASAG
jgi:hypothetical protein